MAKIKDKEAIIFQATVIIAFSGIDKLTMQSLADALGINKASLYHWYSSKDEILEDVFSSGHRSLMHKGFRLELEGSAEEVLKNAAERWSGIFTSDDTLPYLRAVFSLKYTDERAGEEARALELMIESQIDVIMSALGYSDRFLSSLFSSLLLQHLEKILSGDDASCAEDASSFAAFLEKISSH